MEEEGGVLRGEGRERDATGDGGMDGRTNRTDTKATPGRKRQNVREGGGTNDDRQKPPTTPLRGSKGRKGLQNLRTTQKQQQNYMDGEKRTNNNTHTHRQTQCAEADIDIKKRQRKNI